MRQNKLREPIAFCLGIALVAALVQLAAWLKGAPLVFPSVGEILRLTEGTLTPVACVEDPVSCGRSGDCATLPIWKGLNRVIDEYLNSITLQDVLDQQKEHYINDYTI